MLRQAIKENLEAIVKFSIQSHGGEETMAFDLAKQCVDDSDIDKCLGVMLEHVSEEELETLLKVFDTNLFKRYTQGLNESMRTIDNKIESTLRLLIEQGGSC